MTKEEANCWFEAKRHWPTLQQFLGAYLHQDWDCDADSPEQAVDQAVSDYSSAGLQTVRGEWADWKQEVASSVDPRRSLNRGLGVSLDFGTIGDARKFIEMIDQKLEKPTKTSE